MTELNLQEVVMDAAAAAVGAPLADRVADRLRRLIRTGALPAGQALPAAGKINAVGRVTALQVYRQLASEGLISMSPSRGSVVLPQPEHQHYVLIDRRLERGRSQYDYRMLNEIQRHALCGREQPHLHYLDASEVDDMAGLEALVPDVLRQDIAAGRVRGALLSHADHMPVVPQWFQRRGVPTVAFGAVGTSHGVDWDWDLMHRQGVDYLRTRGCERMHVLATGRGIAPLAGADVVWHGNDDIQGGKVRMDKHAISLGREWVAAVLDGDAGADALFITDDLLGLGAVLELERRYGAGPRPRLLLAVHESQLLDAFARCDLLLVRPRDLVAEAVELLESVRPCPPWQMRYVPFNLIPHDKDACP